MHRERYGVAARGLLVAFAAVLLLGSCESPRPSPTSGHLDLHGDRLYYEVAGDGYPLVLASGGSGMDLRQWDRVVEALAREYRVVRYDPRGIGRSDNPGARYSDAADLRRLLDHLKLDRAVVIGVSSAGGMVLEFGLSFPDRTAGIVAVAPFVPGFEFSEAMMARLAAFSQAAQQGREAFLDRMLEDPHFLPAPLDPSLRATARTNMAENFDKSAGFDATLPIELEPPLIERLADIRPPVLLLVGELDHPEVRRRNAFLVESLPAATQGIVDRAGHNVPLENPQGFLDAATPFLRQYARTRGGAP